MLEYEFKSIRIAGSLKKPILRSVSYILIVGYGYANYQANEFQCIITCFCWWFDQFIFAFLLCLLEHFLSFAPCLSLLLRRKFTNSSLLHGTNTVSHTCSLNSTFIQFVVQPINSATIWNSERSFPPFSYINIILWATQTAFIHIMCVTSSQINSAGAI